LEWNRGTPAGFAALPLLKPVLAKGDGIKIFIYL